MIKNKGLMKNNDIIWYLIRVNAANMRSSSDTYRAAIAG